MIRKLFSVTTIFCLIMLMGILTLEQKTFALEIETENSRIRYVYTVHVLDSNVAYCREGDIILGGGARCDTQERHVLVQSQPWLIGSNKVDRWEALCMDIYNPGQFYYPDSIQVICGTDKMKINLPPGLPPFDE
jgi:hypothetical protein